MRARAFLCLLSFLSLGGGAFASAPPVVPAVVTFAAQTAAMENAGVIVHERHIAISAQAGPVHFSQENDAVLLMTDGTYRHIHFTRILENGHLKSIDQMAKTEDASNDALARGNGYFKQPFDRRYLSDYAYEEEAACDCKTGQVAVRFTSALRDEQHGSGQMIVDASSGHVLSLMYTPFVFPDHASAGSVTETFGQALPGLWTIVRIDRTYSGRVLLVTGRGNVSEVLDHFHRFSDPDAGLAFYRTALLQ